MKSQLVSLCHRTKATLRNDSFDGKTVVWYECSTCHNPTGVQDIAWSEHLKSQASKAGLASAANMTKKQRVERAKKAAAARSKS